MSRMLSWRRGGTWGPRSGAPTPRFDSASAIVISSPDDLARLKPRFMHALSDKFDAEALAGRLVPVLLEDHSVAIFALAEHVGSDQADELARRIRERGGASAGPVRYVLAAPLLLAISRRQLSGQVLASPAGNRASSVRTAPAEAFQDVVEWGVRHGASDIHLNVRQGEPESEIKYTVAGQYLAPERFRRLPTSTLFDMLCVAWMDIQGGNGAVFDPGIEQQGSLQRQVDGKRIVLRWSSLAADAGPSVCLRVQQDAAAGLPTLEQLGYLPEQVRSIRRVMLSESGAVIIAGVVGSGKSTSLAALITGLPAHRKVVTIEDPVEYRIPGAIQNTIARHLDTDTHAGFASKLRSLKRSAMTDVLLGEVRDHETGRAFMDLAGSGVNVYTTIHAPSAQRIPDRLASDFIGVPREFLATSGMLKLLIFQALLPLLCQHCALPMQSLLRTDAQWEAHSSGMRWTEWLDLVHALYGRELDLCRVRNARGCESCRHGQPPQLHGYAGRTISAELYEPDLAAGPALSAMDAAVCKARQGLIDLRDIEARFHAFETEAMRRSAHGVPRGFQGLKVAS